MRDLLVDYRDYLTIERRYSTATVETYLGVVRHLCDYLEETGSKPDEVGSEEITAWLKGVRTAKGLLPDPRTAARGISALRSFFRFLVLDERRADNPALLLDRPRTRRRLPQVLSVPEVESFLACIEEDTPLGLRDRALFELIYSCGLRVSEAAGLTRDRYYRDEQILRVIGKGDAEQLCPPWGRRRGTGWNAI